MAFFRAFGIALIAAFAPTALAGSTSVGLQTGKFLNQGVCGQYLLTPDSALNGNFSLVFGTLTLGVDWIHFFGASESSQADYKQLRGRWLPFAGGGLQSGLVGGLRGVAGVQYGMEANPFNFFFSVVWLPGAADWDGGPIGGFLGVRYIL